MIYVLKIDTENDKLVKLQRIENPYYPDVYAGSAQYSLSLEEGELFLRTPSSFMIYDYRTRLTTDGKFKVPLKPGEPRRRPRLFYEPDNLMGEYGYTINKEDLTGLEDATYEYPEETDDDEKR